MTITVDNMCMLKVNIIIDKPIDFLKDSFTDLLHCGETLYHLSHQGITKKGKEFRKDG